MVQNLILRSGSSSIVVAGNNTSDFVKWLGSRLEKKEVISEPLINGVMYNFDNRERAGVVFRGALLEWLWEHRGRKATAVVV